MKKKPQPRAARPTAPAVVWQPAFPSGWMARLAILFGAILLAYWPALSGTQLWDDDQHVTRLDLQPLHGLTRIWTDLSATQQYYPVLHSAFWLEHRLWGDRAVGYHLTNVVLHAIAALLVILIVERLGLPGGWLAGFLFALHPICVESVAWITEQKNTLSGVFYLAATLAFLHFDKTRRKPPYFLGLGFFILALASKSALAALPAILLVLLWWLRGRVEWRRDVLPLLPWFFAAVSFGLLTYYVETQYLGAKGTAFALSLPQRLLLAGRVPWFYASKVVLPVGLVFSYPRWNIDPGEWWQYLFPVGLAAVATFFALLARRNRGPLAAFLIFGGGLFPVLGFLNVFYFRYSYVADHFQYLACLAILVPVAAGLSSLFARMNLPRWRAVLPILLPAALASLTWAQSANYTDVETLYRGILVRNADSWLAHNNLGLLLAQTSGRLAEATVEYREAVRIQPEYPESHFNLGSALAHSGRPEQRPEAIAEYLRALQLKPDYVEARYNLANLLSVMPGRLEDAIAEYRRLLSVEPGLAEAHSNLGNALAQEPGRLPEAIEEYRAALRIKPGLTMQRFNLAHALSEIPGRLPEAITEYQAALRVKPDFAEGHFFLAEALSKTPGRLPDAIAECETALRLDPDLQSAQDLLRRLETERK